MLKSCDNWSTAQYNFSNPMRYNIFTNGLSRKEPF